MPRTKKKIPPEPIAIKKQADSLEKKVKNVDTSSAGDDVKQQIKELKAEILRIKGQLKAGEPIYSDEDFKILRDELDLVKERIDEIKKEKKPRERKKEKRSWLDKAVFGEQDPDY